MLYHVGDSRHTQNIQINKGIGDNEKGVFHFMEKTIRTFWPAQDLEKPHLRTVPRSLEKAGWLGSSPDFLCLFWKQGSAAASVPGRDVHEGQPLMFPPHIDVSLPLFLPPFPSV